MINQHSSNKMCTSPGYMKTLIGWCLYGWASDTFPILITTFIFSTYFIEHVAVSKVAGTYLWANATTVAGLIIAIAGPLFGCLADQRGQRKYWLAFFTAATIICTALLWFTQPTSHDTFYALTLFVIATISFELALIFYNSFLPLIAPPGYIGRLSGWGWGLGYLGGIAALSILLFLAIIAKPSWLNIQTYEQIRLAAPFTAFWYAIFSLPLFFWVTDTTKTTLSWHHTFKKSYQALRQTFQLLRREKNILRFLIARMIFNDGLNTLFAFGGIFAAGTFNFTFSDIIIFGITLNILAGVGAISFAWLDDYIGSKSTILISLSCLIIFSSLLLCMHTRLGFWICAGLLSIFIGPVQSASRSLMTRLAPANKASQLFGFYALTGRMTAFLGPWLLGWATLHFQSQRAGMATILAFFIIGGLLLARVR
jgi:MFS transporter, UMF1 family